MGGPRGSLQLDAAMSEVILLVAQEAIATTSSGRAGAARNPLEGQSKGNWGKGRLPGLSAMGRGNIVRACPRFGHAMIAPN